MKSSTEAAYGIGALLVGAVAFKFWPRTAQPSDTVPAGSVVTFSDGSTQTTTLATNVSALQLAAATSYTTPGFTGYKYKIPALALPAV